MNPVTEAQIERATKVRRAIRRASVADERSRSASNWRARRGRRRRLVLADRRARDERNERRDRETTLARKASTIPERSNPFGNARELGRSKRSQKIKTFGDLFLDRIRRNA